MDAPVTKTAPRPGYTTPAHVVRVLDGDTIEVQIVKTIHVRLLDCWAPEVKGPSKQQGAESKASLQALLGDGKIMLEVPTEENGELAHLFTFGRVLGRIWSGGIDVAAAMVAAGKATKTKTG